jgi:hypothetical protein
LIEDWSECLNKRLFFISYLLDDVLKVDKSEQKGGFRYKLDDHIPLTEYNSIDKETKLKGRHIYTILKNIPRDI